MTISSDLTAIPAPRKRGRPKKIQPDNSVLLRAQAQEIAELKERLAQALAAQPTPVELPKPGRPGELIEVGRDHRNSPIYMKVRWTRKSIAATYPPVTFAPNRTMRVSPHGVAYDLVAGENCTVPSIVKTSHDDTLRSEAMLKQAFRPWSAAELDDLSQRAMAEPGHKHASRVARLGVGLYVGDQRPEPPA